MKIYSLFSIRSHDILRQRSQMSRLIQVLRQVIVYLSTLSLGIIPFYRTDIKCFSHTFCVKFYLMEGKAWFSQFPKKNCFLFFYTKRACKMLNMISAWLIGSTLALGSKRPGSSPQGEKIFPHSFLNCDLMIAVYLRINS